MGDSTRSKVLAIDDERNVLDAIKEALEPEFDVQTADRGGTALDILSKERPDVAILDYRLPDIPGDVLAGRIRALHPSLPLIVLSVVTDVACAVHLMQQGIADYLTKPFDVAELRALIRRTVGTLPQEALFARCESLMGVSSIMTTVQRRIEEAARSGRHLLFTTEHGFDLVDVARYLAVSTGPRTPLLLVQADDRPAIPATFPLAARGVAYISLSPESAPVVTATLETARWRRAMGSRVVQIVFDASAIVSELLSPEQGPLVSRQSGFESLVAVTNDLSSMCTPYRGEVERIDLPPLRERPEDIPHCLRYFIEKHALVAGRRVRSISLEVMDLLLSYSWPGNILEMNCVIAEIVRGGSGPEIGADALTRLHAGAFTDMALRASRFAGESLQEGLRRLDRLLCASAPVLNTAC